VRGWTRPVRIHPRTGLESPATIQYSRRDARRAGGVSDSRTARGLERRPADLDPSLRRLERAILTQDPALAPPSGADGNGGDGRGREQRRPPLLALAAVVGVLAVSAALALALGRGERVAHAVALPNSVAVVDPKSNRVVASVAVGARPGSIAFGAGSVWVGNRDDASISRIAPSHLAVARTIAVGAEPTGIAASRGTVWVVSADAAAPAVAVTRIDPRFDTVTTRHLDNVVAGGSGTVVATSAAVWVAPSSGLLSRLSARTGRVLRRIDPGTSPTGVAAGGGALWLANSDADTVTRVDPTGLTTPIPVGRGPAALAFGAGSLSGPECYLAYGRLDAELAREAAPWVAFENRPSVALLSARVGCDVYQPVYGIDVAALCVRGRDN
jgi:YVTN family beta-propeller protein